ncbi:SDR family NAD(P)-dependent oxidoreductase [Streptomyces sp. Inha503]|uniref:SDR family NAD(P)-dependent oxidoreductase n=1 Tax=Streptomyces sp. Inha503 TaxID=3383314 RepID=UPI0039A382E5
MIPERAPGATQLKVDLRDRVAIVAGAGRGIGAAAARTLATAGASVVCGARSRDELDALVKEIEEMGGEATGICADIADPDSVESLVQAAVDQYGRLDLAFNNAAAHAEGPLHELTIEDFDRVVGVNLRGTFICLKHEISAMLSSGGGAIVNTASVGGVIGEKFISPYIASKHGVVGLTKAAALDYADRGIRVNCLAPGATRTRMLLDWLSTDEMMEAIVGKTPIGRLADPQEIANVAVFLLSDAASFVTGATYLADGGLVVP